VLQEILPGGGHVGFAASGEPQWLERRILQFVTRQFAADLRPS
jgi:predicted alpha/beta-fold hydrolase